MNYVKTYLYGPGTTLDEVRAVYESNDDIRTYFINMSPSNRSHIRRRLKELGYDADVIAYITYLNKPYVKPLNSISIFRGIRYPVRQLIGGIYNVDPGNLEIIPIDSWTADMVTLIVKGIEQLYTNVTTSSLACSNLRKVLRQLYMPNSLPEDVIIALRTPYLTAQSNAVQEDARIERADNGLEIPSVYKSIDMLKDRVITFLASNRVDAQVAADLCVVLSCRPGEANLINVGEKGGIVGLSSGILKKRVIDHTAIYPIASALSDTIAIEFLLAWRKTPIILRQTAMKDLSILCNTWGIQRRDLRAIGSQMAVNASIIAGTVKNDVQISDIRRIALRHEDNPMHRPAADRYARINNPSLQLATIIDNMPDADRNVLLAYITDAQRVGPPREFARADSLASSDALNVMADDIKKDDTYV